MIETVSVNILLKQLTKPERDTPFRLFLSYRSKMCYLSKIIDSGNVL